MPAWWQDWEGETALLVASGPSAKDIPLELARGRVKAIAVNNSWELCPWADILYATDGAWWRANKDAAARFQGLRLTSDGRAAEELGLAWCKCRKPDDRILLDKPGEIGWGGNSGFHAINLAIQFGARRLLLVGYDMTLKYGIHWHGEHDQALHNPNEKNVDRWRRAVDGAATVAKMVGVDIVNCSPISALQQYRKSTLEEELAA